MGRAFRLRHKEGAGSWVAAESVPLATASYPDGVLIPEPGDVIKSAEAWTADDAVLALVRGWVECSGPFTAGEMSARLHLSEGNLNISLARLEAEGVVLRGQFRPGTAGEEFCDRRILARIHRATISRLRKEVEPVAPAAFVRFLFQWQHLGPGSQLKEEGGLLDAIESLQGFEAAAGSWESELLPSRVSDYHPFLLDRLCMEGEVVWDAWRAIMRTGAIPRAAAP